MYIDIHTHRQLVPDDVTAVMNVALRMAAKPSFSPADKVYWSAGVHPWHATEWVREEPSLLSEVLGSENVLFIGETGLDRRCDTPWEDQLKMFKIQLELADSFRKPVMLHAVRAVNEMIGLPKQYPHIPAWIVHGFRGKPEELNQWVRHGFYVSFGVHFNAQSLKCCPADRLLLETDESVASIVEVYHSVAQVLECSIESLVGQVESNFSALIQ